MTFFLLNYLNVNSSKLLAHEQRVLWFANFQEDKRTFPICWQHLPLLLKNIKNKQITYFSLISLQQVIFSKWKAGSDSSILVHYFSCPSSFNTHYWIFCFVTRFRLQASSWRIRRILGRTSAVWNMECHNSSSRSICQSLSGPAFHVHDPVENSKMKQQIWGFHVGPTSKFRH